MAQAEHDEDASSIFISTSSAIITEVKKVIENELPALKREAIINNSLKSNGLIIKSQTLEQSIQCINKLAPAAAENSPLDSNAVTLTVTGGGGSGGSTDNRFDSTSSTMDSTLQTFDGT